MHLSITIYIYILFRLACPAHSFLGSILERGWDDGVLVLGHPHQRRLHRVVILQWLPAATTKRAQLLQVGGWESSCQPWLLLAGGAAYLYRQTRWWTKTQISSFARLIPGHIRGPLPNPRKLYGLSVSCAKERTWHQVISSLPGGDRHRRRARARSPEINLRRICWGRSVRGWRRWPGRGGWTPRPGSPTSPS